jgi:serine/threonine protein kinase
MSGRQSGPPGASSSVPPGTQLNGIYEIDSLIGIGGMGEVFKGHNIQTGDPVAIKIVLPEYAKDELILDLFRKEARILNHLAHDAIVRYYVFTVAAELGRPYLAMEYVDGPSLAEHLKARLPSTDDVLVLQQRLADGLQKAHEAGVIHRDISPDNVILPDGQVERAKIIDFGIARSARVGGATLLGGSFAGKYNFVSPEQLGLFGGEVTPRSDVYGLGLVLAAALRGRPIDMGGSQVEVVEKRRVVPDLSGIDPRLQPLLRAMLQPDPAHRMGAMSEVRDWRPAARPERPARENTIVMGDRPPPRTQPMPPPRAPATKSAKPAKRRGGLVIAALSVAAIAAGAFGGWWYVEEHSGSWYKPPPETARVPPEPQQGNQTAKPPPENTTKETTTALVTKPPEPVAPPPPSQIVTHAAELISFINTYDGGDCFFAAPETIADGSASIVGYGNRREAFDRFFEAFKAKAGFNPNIRLSSVSDSQCPVVSALKALTSNPAHPVLHLDKDVLQVGASLEGTVAGVAGRNIQILLVDHEGVVQNLRAAKNAVTQSGDNITFRIKLSSQQQLENSGQGAYLPMLILSVGSSKPIESLASLEPALASDLMPKLVAETQKTGDIAATTAYFKLVGPKG